MVRQASDARKSVPEGDIGFLPYSAAPGDALFFLCRSVFSGNSVEGKGTLPVIETAVLFLAAGTGRAVVERVDDAAPFTMISCAGMPERLKMHLQMLKRRDLAFDVGNMLVHKIVDPCAADRRIVLKCKKIPDFGEIHAVQPAAADEMKPFHGVVSVEPVV